MDSDIGRTAHARLADPMEDLWLTKVRPTIKAGVSYQDRVCRSAWRNGFAHGQLSLCECLRNEAEALPRIQRVRAELLRELAERLEGMQR